MFDGDDKWLDDWMAERIKVLHTNLVQELGLITYDLLPSEKQRSEPSLDDPEVMEVVKRATELLFASYMMTVLGIHEQQFGVDSTIFKIEALLQSAKAQQLKDRAGQKHSDSPWAV